MTSIISAAAKRYGVLVDWGVLTGDALSTADYTASARGLELERVLISEYCVPKYILLQALSEYYNCPFAEYDERLPIPPELLTDLDGERLSINQWFPIIKDGNTVIIAANNPSDPLVHEEVKKFIKADKYEFWAALGEDVQWFIQDFLHAKPGYLIGTERTGLAFWRNTMAQWRTRLACYRTDLAMGRTYLSFLRWGLGLIAISDTLMRAHKSGPFFYLYVIMAGGFLLALFGLSGYLEIRKFRMKPPGEQTLVEVTAATVQFLENYHFVENTGASIASKQTMLARLGDFLADHCTILYPSPSSRERTHLARERNVLAAQRTVAACYRTIYARARTGLAFIRTGVSFAGLGLGLMRYFGFSLLTAVDSLLISAGILMIIDGWQWYMPVRKEQAEVPRCPVPE
ncbi:MAG: type II secretion protein [Dissulfurispiraceae bacterium]